MNNYQDLGIVKIIPQIKVGKKITSCQVAKALRFLSISLRPSVRIDLVCQPGWFPG